MLDGQKLSAVSKRALSEQPYFRQAVENDPVWLYAFNGIEDELDCLPELEVGRIEQALLLISGQQGFRGLQFVYFDV